MVIDTDAVAKKLALPTLRPYVSIAKFAAWVTACVYVGNAIKEVRNYPAIFAITFLAAFGVWKAARFMDGLGRY